MPLYLPFLGRLEICCDSSFCDVYFLIKKRHQDTLLPVLFHLCHILWFINRSKWYTIWGVIFSSWKQLKILLESSLLISAFFKWKKLRCAFGFEVYLRVMKAGLKSSHLHWMAKVSTILHGWMAGPSVC